MKISTKVWKYGVLVLLAGIFVWLICTVFEPFEPRQPEYQGKKLTDWANEIDQNIFVGSPASLSNQLQSELAISAIRHIGTNALPTALRLCAAKDSWVRQHLAERVEQYNNNNWPKRFPMQIIPAWEKNSEGANIIWALGPIAEPAIPSLVRMLQSGDREVAESAMTALPGIGTNVVPPLVELLNSPDEDIRIRAAIILGENFGPHAHAAVPVLLNCVENQKPDSVTRIRAIYSLSFIKEDAPVIVPAILHRVQSETNGFVLKNPNFFILRDCLITMGNFGTNAEAAVPMLVNMLEADPQFPSPLLPSGYTQALVLGTLEKIDPETAKPFMEEWKASLTNVKSGKGK